MSYIPDIAEIYEGGDSPIFTYRNVGENYPFRVQLVENDGSKFDTTASTLTAALYNSSGASVVITPTLTKDLNELGIVHISGITFSTAGLFNFYIVSTVSTVVRKFGPYKINVRAL